MAVYFIRCKNWVKIGRATNVRARFNQVQCHSPFRMTLIGSFPGGPREERVLHWRFRGLRGKGEWFFIDGALEDLLSRMVRDEHSRSEVEKEISNYRSFLPDSEPFQSSKLSGKTSSSI